MNNLSLSLNAILLVAVGVLFYLHFSSGNPSTISEAATTPGDLKIAYINTDTVLKYYEYLKTTQAGLEEKNKKMEQDYRNRAMGLQNEITAYQRNVSNMTLGQVKAVEEDLGKKQQNLQMYQQSLSQQLMDEQGKIQKELYERITAFLKKYGKEKGLQVVLKFDPMSDVLFAGLPLDISQDVITGLNEEYKLEKTGAPAKADSTKAK